MFNNIHTLNRHLLATQPDLEQDLQNRAEQLRLDLASNQVADNREFFYALQPRARLTWLAERVWSKTGQS